MRTADSRVNKLDTIAITNSVSPTRNHLSQDDVGGRESSPKRLNNTASVDRKSVV